MQSKCTINTNKSGAVARFAEDQGWETRKEALVTDVLGFSFSFLLEDAGVLEDARAEPLSC
jgi:hypothetical protein